MRLYGAEDRNGGSFIAQLEDQIGEALALFENFERAQAEVAGVTATVSDATCRSLRSSSNGAVAGGRYPHHGPQQPRSNAHALGGKASH